MAGEVVISGAGVVSPLANDLEEFWNALDAGNAAFSEILRFPVNEYRCKKAAMIKSLPNVEGLLSTRERILDPSSILLLLAIWRAIENSGLKAGSQDLAEAVLVVGTSLGGIPSGELYHRELISKENGPAKWTDRTREYDPCLYTYYGPAVAIAKSIGIRGGLLVINTGCTSSSHAIAIGAELIRSGRNSIAVVGGVDYLCAFVYSGFNSLGILMKEPIDKDAKGLLLGEGAGAIILEEIESARKRGIDPHVYFVGHGASSGIKPNDLSDGLEMAMETACRDALIPVRDIDLINGQSLERSPDDSRHYQVFRKFFGERICQMGFFSLKSLVGHTLGASGIFDFITSYLILKNGRVPLGLLSKGCTRAKRRKIKAILTSESAFGENHVALIVAPKKGMRNNFPSSCRVVITGRAGISSSHLPNDITEPMEPWRIITSDSRYYELDACRILEEIKRRWIKDKSRFSRMDRFCRLSMIGVHMALKNSGLLDETRAKEVMGVVLGTAFGCIISNERHHRDLLLKGPGRVSPLIFPYTIPNAALSEIAMNYGIKGPSLCLTSGWSSGIQSIGISFDMIRSNRIKRAIAGGVDCTGEILIRGLQDSRMGKYLCQPREGLGLVVLEEREEAKSREAAIEGEVLGFGMSFSSKLSGPELVKVIINSVLKALGDAQLSMMDVEIIIPVAPTEFLNKALLRAIDSLTMKKKTIIQPPLFKGEAFSATAPLYLILKGLSSLDSGKTEGSISIGSSLIVAACPTGGIASILTGPSSS